MNILPQVAENDRKCYLDEFRLVESIFFFFHSAVSSTSDKRSFKIYY